MFLTVETATQPLTLLYLAILQPGVDTDGRPVPLKMLDLRARFEQRLDILPSFRWRLVRVPFGLHHPVWADDPDFDLDRHLRHVVLESPGDASTLDREVARLAEEVFDRRRPMWQISLVDGLEHGQQALILSFHHAMCDGMATRTVVERLFGEYDEALVDDASPWHPERPRRFQLVKDAMRDQARLLCGLPGLVWRTGRNAIALRARRRRSATRVPMAVTDTPGCSRPQSFSGVRKFARTTVDLADMVHVKDGAAVKLNDVALTMVSSALRHYLLARDDLPDRPLTVNVPVSTEPPGAPPRHFGNRLSNLLTTLATEVPDPWDRMQVISETTTEAKKQLGILGPEIFGEWLEYAMPVLAEPAWRVWARIRERKPKLALCVQVSNVRGARVPLSLGTTQVVEGYFIAPAVAGGGPDVMFWTYGDKMAISVLVNPEQTADPEELAISLRAALSELVEIGDARQAIAAPVGVTPEAPVSAESPEKGAIVT